MTPEEIEETDRDLIRMSQHEYHEMPITFNIKYTCGIILKYEMNDYGEWICKNPEMYKLVAMNKLAEQVKL